jgi:arsenate reductase-like glutaredoxin family protein
VWPLPGTIVEERAIITALLEALEQMPEDRKKILKQYFGIGDAEGNRKTLEEIASELSCTKETVRNQLGTALRELRILLNQFDDKPLTKITRREREVVKKKIITRDQVLEAHATCGGRLDEASKLLIASKGWIRKIWKEANLTVARPDKTISSETFDAIDRLIFQHAPDKAIVAQLRIPRTVIGQQRVKIGKLNFEEWKARRAELNIK